MEHSATARSVHQPTQEMLRSLAADAVLLGHPNDLAYALYRLTDPPIEAIVSASRVADLASARELLEVVAKVAPQWLQVQDEHGDSPASVAARRLDFKSLALLFRHGVPAVRTAQDGTQDASLLELINTYPHADNPQSHERVRATRKVIVRALAQQGADLNATVGVAIVQALANDDAQGAMELYRLHKVSPSTRFAGRFLNKDVSLLGELAGHSTLTGSGQKVRLKVLDRLARDFPTLAQTPADDLGSALHRAASADFPKMVKALVKLGFSPTTPDLEGKTPAHYAATNMDAATLKVLLSASKRVPLVGVLDHAGNTPLHAVFGDRSLLEETSSPEYLLQTIDVLVAAGADCGARNHQGKTPLDLAVEWELPHTVLRHLGATIPKKKPA